MNLYRVNAKNDMVGCVGINCMFNISSKNIWKLHISEHISGIAECRNVTKVVVVYIIIFHLKWYENNYV